MTALAVFLGFVLLALVVYGLGSRWLDLMAAEMEVEPGSRRVRKAFRRPAEETDQDEDEDDDEEAEVFAAAVREVDQFDQIGKQAWVDEKRAEGWDEEEIDRWLNEREPVARVNA